MGRFRSRSLWSIHEFRSIQRNHDGTKLVGEEILQGWVFCCC